MITCTNETYQEEEVIRLVLEHYEQGIALHKQAVFGSNAFIFEILDTQEKKEEQSQEEFLDDLKPSSKYGVRTSTPQRNTELSSNPTTTIIDLLISISFLVGIRAFPRTGYGVSHLTR